MKHISDLFPQTGEADHLFTCSHTSYWLRVVCLFVAQPALEVLEKFLRRRASDAENSLDSSFTSPKQFLHQFPLVK